LIVAAAHANAVEARYCCLPSVIVANIHSFSPSESVLRWDSSKFVSKAFHFQNRYKEKANFLFQIKMLLPNIIISVGKKGWLIEI